MAALLASIVQLGFLVAVVYGWAVWRDHPGRSVLIGFAAMAIPVPLLWLQGESDSASPIFTAGLVAVAGFVLAARVAFSAALGGKRWPARVAVVVVGAPVALVLGGIALLLLVCSSGDGCWY